MHKNHISLFFIGITIIFLATLSYCSKLPQPLDKTMMNKAFHTPDIVSLFAVTPESIALNTSLYIQEAQDAIDAIIAIPAQQRTYTNTAKALDEVVALSNLAVAKQVYEALELLSPDDNIRNAAHDAFLQISAFWVDALSSNKALYQAFMEYALHIMEHEALSPAQRYFIHDVISSFKREGLSLPDEILAQVTTLRKELAVLSADFDRNIAQDKSTITVTKENLAGMDDDFINALKKNDDGLYVIGVDYPTYFRIMENCSVAQTRKQLYLAFQNRAYPINESILTTIIAKRNELAQLLGYASFAAYDIDDQMAHTPEKAYNFITSLAEQALPKAYQEIATLTKTLPAGVILSENGKVQPWDLAYLENNYKKTHFNLDEQKIAEYFPMKKTIDELLDIYRQFFSIDFQEVPSSGLWHQDVTVLRVNNKKNNEIIGTLILDLHPRPNKYSHAAHTTIIPGTYVTANKLVPDLSIIIANFPHPTASQPSLLKRSEVTTFFHEFGHGLHAILGATEIASLSGTHTKTDFVELPSQMLEEWLTDKDMLKKVSGHYATGQPLPDDIIDTIIKLKNLSSGHFVMRQAFQACLALAYFGAGENKDPYTIMKQLYTTNMPYMECDDAFHFYTAFGHLTGYGAKYYGYLWSKVFSLDIFATIKKQGLLNPEIGHIYTTEILSKGGAQDPNELLYNYLGREPNMHAFLTDMGLTDENNDHQ
jgi:thimet oligopeptidase